MPDLASELKSFDFLTCTFNRKTLIVGECSDTLARALGMETSQEMIGRFVLDVFKPGSFEVFEHFVKGGDFSEGILCNLATPGGDGARVAVGIANSDAEDEQLAMVCLVVEDQQPRVAFLESQLETLEQQNDRLRDFTSLVVHDLANALQTITAGVPILQMKLDAVLTPKSRHKFQRVAEASLTMNGILTGVMKYLRFEVGEYPMELTDIHALVDALVVNSVDLPGKIVSIRRTTDLPSLVCERQLIQELFRNVVGNAIKYCDKERIEIEIGSEDSGGDDAVFFVRDNGVGIHETDLSKVFAPFKRADRRGLNSSGTGMGMMLVKRIVERHGGEIWLESEVQQGTTVRFSLSSNPQPRA